MSIVEILNIDRMLRVLLVKTRIGISSIHGVGLFSEQFIPKGTITWEYHPLFDSSFTEEEISRMSLPAKKQFFNYAYFDKDLNKYVLCFDDQRFINHGIKKLNIHSTVRNDIAARDIQPGEELLCDYDKYDDTYFIRHKIKKEYLIEKD